MPYNCSVCCNSTTAYSTSINYLVVFGALRVLIRLAVDNHQFEDGLADHTSGDVSVDICLVLESLRLQTLVDKVSLTGLGGDGQPAEGK